jgi:hyperosmotically inducible protein
MTFGARFAAIAVTSACLLGPGVASADPAADAWITAKVKAALLAAPGVGWLAIDVDTFEGLVTLHGMVDNEAERLRAEKAARDVDGVRELRNLTAVVPVAARAQVDERDARLARVLEAALESDPELESSRIDVESVHDGVVVLGGEAITLVAHRRALEVARAGDGVRHVASEIHSPDELGDEELWEETGTLAARPMRL